MKKKVLITGASGFIGSFLVEEALMKGYEVYAGIRKSSSRQYLQHKDLNFFELDFNCPGRLENQLAAFYQERGKFDFVIHNAGITQAKKKEEFDRVNYQYTKKLADALLASQMPLEKFILVSSLASFGPGEKKDMRPIHISDQQNPISSYGKSKLDAASYIKQQSVLPYHIIYPTAVYGPRDKDFLQFIKLVSRGFEPYIGRHRQMISMVYVKDLARAIISLMGSEIVNSSYIISDGNHYHKEQLGDAVRQVLQKKTLKLKLPLKPLQITISAVDRIYGLLFNRLPFINREKLDEISSANWLCDSKEVWNSIGDHPGYDLHLGIAETIEWYRQNQWL